MVLAIGLVVDDAIVVLENIFRHIEDGMAPVKAAIRGINEIAFAVIAMTLTLVAVYAPMAFATGRTGKLFIEFALTLAGAVLVSGFVALTLTPMMCAKLLRHETSHGRFYNWLERGFEAMTRGYRRMLVGRARDPPGRRAHRRARRRRQRLPVREPALGARPCRGPRHDQRARRRAGRGDARLHHRIRPPGRGVLRGHPGGAELSHHRRLPGRDAARARSPS